MEDYIKNYLDEKSLSKSPRTIQNYRVTLRFYEGWIKKPVELATKADIVKFQTYLLNDKHLSRASVETYSTQLKTFYTWMHDEGIVKENVLRRVDKIRADKKDPIWLTLKEMEDLLVTASVRPRDMCMIKMMYSTGVRISELVNIKKGDINFERNTIKVFGKGAKERIVMIPPWFKDELQIYTDAFGPGQVLFDYAPGTVQRDIRTLARQAGIKKKVTPHKLRHTFATHMLQSGSNIEAIRKLMGHTSLTTTQIYMHYGDDELQTEYAKHPMFKQG